MLKKMAKRKKQSQIHIQFRSMAHYNFETPSPPLSHIGNDLFANCSNVLCKQVRALLA